MKASGQSLVLVLEEETQQLDAISGYLESEGFEVVRCATSDDALEACRGNADIRAVVTDAHVPGTIDGVDFAHLVRREWPEKALVLMSGHSDALSGPVPDEAVFINKPNVLEYLAPTLRRML